MAKKRPPSGRCVHCLQHFGKLTWDHVFPEAWYPNTTPENTEKWKIPSCLNCNGIHSKNEGDLLVRFGLCINPKDTRSAGIADRVMRALKPQFGKSQRDADAREAKRSQILSQSFSGEKIPRSSLYPGFDIEPKYSESMAVAVSVHSLQLFVEKLVRGLTFIQDNKFIEPSYSIEHHVLSKEDAKPIQEELDRFGVTHECGPGIRVVRAVVPEDRISALFKIEIWGRLTMYASVVEKIEIDMP